MIKIRKFRKADTKEVALLIKKTFKRFNSKDYFKKSAVHEFINSFDPNKNTISKIYEKFLKTPIFYVAENNNKIVGMVRGRPDRIVNLFVDEVYQKKGIGKKLVEKFEAVARKYNTKEIKIRSSIFAVPFYEKMGYRKTTGIRNFHGLKVWPMKKTISKKK